MFDIKRRPQGTPAPPAVSAVFSAYVCLTQIGLPVYCRPFVRGIRHSSTTIPRVFPDTWTGALFSILLHTSTIISSTTAPIIPIITPGRNAFHSGINAIHVPSANRIHPMVPKIIVTKLLFFISLFPFLKTVYLLDEKRISPCCFPCVSFLFELY